MPVIVSDPNSSAVKGFRTYLNYLSAVKELFKTDYGRLHRYCDECLKATQKLQGAKHLDQERVRRFLKLAWNTEHLLHASGSEDAEIQRLNNHWAPVQAYYAVYCSAEAAGYVLDGHPPGSHAKALRKITDYARRVGLRPWNVVATGARGRSGANVVLEGIPDSVEIPSNLQQLNVDPLGMLGRCLGAEHKIRINEEWSRERSGCYKYDFDPGPTGLLYFLYRLRIKANYRDVDVFLAAATEREVLDFGRSLRFLVVLALIVCEVVVIRKIGKRGFLQFSDEYLARNDSAKVLAHRAAIYRELV